MLHVFAECMPHVGQKYSDSLQAIVKVVKKILKLGGSGPSLQNCSVFYLLRKWLGTLYPGKGKT